MSEEDLNAFDTKEVLSVPKIPTLESKKNQWYSAASFHSHSHAIPTGRKFQVPVY